MEYTWNMIIYIASSTPCNLDHRGTYCVVDTATYRDTAGGSGGGGTVQVHQTGYQDGLLLNLNRY